MEKAIQITVSGRVQGVGFRYYTQKVARAWGLKGFVKNLSNGDVYIEVQGPPDQLSVFLLEIRKGPIMSRVEKMEVCEMFLQGTSGFEIR